MNNKLPIPSKIKDYFSIEIQHDDFAVKGKLICSCGADRFKMFYFGKKGSFLSPTINKQKTKNGRRIAIKAECNECHKVISIYDSFVDGLNNIHSGRVAVCLFNQV